VLGGTVVVELVVVVELDGTVVVVVEVSTVTVPGVNSDETRTSLLTPLTEGAL
jgi:hypothetical protein